MRRFSFKLEKVLELRRYAEQEWELKLAEVTTRVVAVEQEIADWALRRHETGRFQASIGTLDMLLIRGREEFVNRIDLRVTELQHQMIALEAERAQVRVGYVEASKKRKALTKLKERRSEEYYREALREEGRIVDEVAASQLIRRRLETEEINV